MFNKKSDDQEWTRFRGAPGREREEVPADEAENRANPGAPSSAPATGSTGTTSSTINPSLRSTTGEMGVGIPSRPPRVLSDGEIESLVGENTSFEGTFTCEGAVRIHGSIQGELISKGSVYIEEKARVNAKITAAQITVAGRVDGQIQCQGKVEIRPTGRVTGEIQAGALIVQEGAFFEGNSKMASTSSSSHGASPIAPGISRP